MNYDLTIVFEPTYSLKTMMQAIKRIWRLGQDKPVRTIWCIYKGTMEAKALRLMGQKMKAMLTLYGDTASTTLTNEVGGGDLLAELAASVLNNADDVNDGIDTLLAAEFTTSDEATWLDFDGMFEFEPDEEPDIDTTIVIDSPPTINVNSPLGKWLTDNGFDTTPQTITTRKPRVSNRIATDSQLSLFELAK